MAVQGGAAVASALTPTVIAPGVAAALGLGGSAAGAVTAAGLAIAIPIVGVAIAGLTFGIEAILNSGCGQTCVVTSQWANQAEPFLQKNIANYFAIAPPRPMSVQQLALGNFDAIWNTLTQQCNQPGLGTAGQNCINDRKSGACKWKATSQGYPGSPAAGACWNWFSGYRDPIANDTQVYNDGGIQPSSAGTPGTVGTVSTGFDPTILMIGGGLLLALFMVSQL